MDRLSPLMEPARRRAFSFVAAAAAPVTREETTDATGLSLALATFHLERLLEAGLVEAGFAADVPPGVTARRGRGRPAKRYRAARGDISLSLPARNYRLAAELLADALPPEIAPTALDVAARRRGRAIGRSVEGSQRRLVDVLAGEGYLPRTVNGRIEFGNCPFEGLTEGHGDLICPANLALLQGVLEGAGVSDMEARLDAGDGRCCVVLQPATDDSKA